MSDQHRLFGTPFAVIPEWVLYHPDVDCQVLRTYAVLQRFANAKGVCWPGRELLAERVGCSVRTVSRCVSVLESIGAVLTKRRFQSSNVYIVRVDDPYLDVQDAAHMAEDEATDVQQDAPICAASGPLTKAREQEPVNNDVADAPKVPNEEVVLLCAHLADVIETHRGVRPKMTAAWTRDMDLLVRRGDPDWDKPAEVQPERVRRAIDFVFKQLNVANSGGFCWADVIRSPSALRRNYQKIRDEHRKRTGSNGNGHAPPPGAVPGDGPFSGIVYH